jgi:hypothetical protein
MAYTEAQVSLSWPLATISPFALKLASNWSAVATHWESASTGDIRSALVWLVLPFIQGHQPLER